MYFLPFIILPLAIARLTLIFVRDDIFQPIRHILFLFFPPENSDRMGYYYQNYIRSTERERDLSKAVFRGETILSSPTIGHGFFERKFIATDTKLRDPSFIGKLFSCPDCLGVWVAALYLGMYFVFPHFAMLLSYVLSASMVTSLIARRY